MNVWNCKNPKKKNLVGVALGDVDGVLVGVALGDVVGLAVGGLQIHQRRLVGGNKTKSHKAYKVGACDKQVTRTPSEPLQSSTPIPRCLQFWIWLSYPWHEISSIQNSLVEVSIFVMLEPRPAKPNCRQATWPWKDMNNQVTYQSKLKHSHLYLLVSIHHHLKYKKMQLITSDRFSQTNWSPVTTMIKFKITPCLS